MRLLLLASAVAAAVLAVGQPTGAQSGEQPGVVEGPDCVKVTGVAIYRSGYTHVVRVRNECAGAARCEVSTDVDPSPTYALTVPAGQTREQTTRIGSPSYGFTARARCTVEGGAEGSPGGATR